MLHKFNDPKDDGFQRLSSRLQEFAEKADDVLRQKSKYASDQLSSLDVNELNRPFSPRHGSPAPAHC